MREEIRLGNEALARNDIETARQHFQQILETGGTLLQERIATNRLREIQKTTEALLNPSSTKPRARRKTAGVKKADSDTAPRKVIRPPDKPLVVIQKH